MTEKNISIYLTLKNRANLLEYNLESISRQKFDGNIEVCIIDGGSTDNLLSVLDRASDLFPIRYCVVDRKKSTKPIRSNCPAIEHNLGIKYLINYDTVIKIDPEVVMKDDWLIDEIWNHVAKDPIRMYNARAHFTQGNGWYSDLDDIIKHHESYYLIAEGGPFSRSKFYFCSGFSRTSFLMVNGVDERFVEGDGWEDTCFREHWKNVHGSYEYEITAQAIHLWHEAKADQHSAQLYELNHRRYEQLKYNPGGNLEAEQPTPDPEAPPIWRPTPWADINLLSKIYTIKDGRIIDTTALTEQAQDLDLPF